MASPTMEAPPSGDPPGIGESSGSDVAVLIGSTRRATQSSASSSTSSLEPLTSAFDIATPFSPSPSPNATPTGGRSPRKRTESIESSTPPPPDKRRRRRRSVSAEPPAGGDDGRSSSGPVTRTFGLNWGGKKSPKPQKELSPPIASPTSSNLSLPLSPGSPLIADYNVSKSRLLITKTHVAYPAPTALIPFHSCILGFRMLIHTADPKARVKYTQITLTLHPTANGPLYCRPIIKAIYPTQGVMHVTGEGTVVKYRDENQLGVSLGFDPYGQLQLAHISSQEFETKTSPYLLGSGVETSKLLLTLNEDSTTHSGVPPSLDFAVLLYLPSPTTRAFDCELSVETSPGGELGSALRRMLGSPRVMKMTYDGVTELGALSIGGMVPVTRDLEGYESSNDLDLSCTAST